MKSIFIILTLGLFLGALEVSADPTEPLTDEPLRRLDQFLKNTNPTPEEASRLGAALQTLAYDISQKLIGAESKDWGNPSPQRLAIIEDAQKLLTPHNKNLIRATFELTSPLSRYVGRQSRSLLDYTKADHIYETELRQRIYKPDMKECFVAADLLLEHRKLTSDDRAALVAVSALAKTDEEKILWAKSLVRFGMPNGLPIIKKLLEIPFDPAGIIGDTGVAGTSISFSRNYGPSSEAVVYLGTDAAHLIPLMEQRLGEIEKSNLGDAGVPLIRSIQISIRHAKGELPRKRRYAVNGTGWLDEPSRQVESAETPTPPPAASGPIIVNYPKPEPTSKPLPAAPTPKDNNPVWWIVGLIILAGGVVFVARKKKPRA